MTLAILSKKISQITVKYLGCTIEIFDSKKHLSLDGSAQSHVHTALRNTRASRIYSGLDVIVPLRIGGHLEYIVIIKKGFALKLGHIDTLTKTMENVIGAYHNDDNVLNYLNDYSLVLQNSVKKNNVVDLSVFRQKRMSRENMSNFVVTSDVQNVRKIAIDIFHEHNYLGLVPWVALDVNSIKSIEDICRLGKITIFIQDVSKMSKKHQSLMEKYFSMKPVKGTPRFIIGISLTELQNTAKVSEGLAKLLQVHV